MNLKCVNQINGKQYKAYSKYVILVMYFDN